MTDPIREVFDISVPWITGISTREVPCLLCGERHIRPLSTFLLNGRRFHVVRCEADGMMWLDPQPTREFYAELYAEHYHQTGADDPLLEQATLDVLSDEVKLQETAVLRVDGIEQVAPRGRLLEVGFGGGYTLLEARSRGWDVFGIEIAQSRVDAMRQQGIPATCADLPAYTEQAASFDVVAMYNMIEHTLNPPNYLRRAHELLKPGGILMLRLPNTQDEGPPASLIAHVYHFNQATISTLLARCGFVVLGFGAFFPWRPKRYPGELWSMNVASRKT